MTVEMILMVIGIMLFGISSILAIATIIRPGSFSENNTLFVTAIAAAFIATALAIHGVRSGHIPAFGRFEAFACYSLAVTVAYLHLSIHNKLQGVSAILLPYATILLIFGGKALGEEPSNIINELQNIWLGLHILTAFIGYALFTLSSVLSIAYLIQDFNLKHKLFGVVFQRLPALETLDDLTCKQMRFAFLMLSISMIAGTVLVRQIGGGAEWITDPKIAATLVTWIIYAILIHLRINADKHGKKIAIVTILGLVCVLFTFIGIHMITDSVHDFVLPEITGAQK